MSLISYSYVVLNFDSSKLLHFNGGINVNIYYVIMLLTQYITMTFCNLSNFFSIIETPAFNTASRFHFFDLFKYFV